MIDDSRYGWVVVAAAFTLMLVGFSAAYSFGKTRGVADEDEGGVSIARPLEAWFDAPYASSQAHNLVVNYTWDTPKLSRLFGD